MKNIILIFHLAVYLGYFPIAAQNCNPIVLVAPGDNIAGGTIVYEAITIEASNEISGNADVTYQAQEYILLTDNFLVSQGSKLWAHLEACIVNTNDLHTAGLEVHFNNPVTTLLTMNVTLDKAATVEILLFDALGQQVRLIQVPQLMTEGIHAVETDLSDLPAACYFLLLRTSEDTQQTLRMVKL